MNPDDFINSMNPDNLRVHAPSVVLFLCGGITDEEAETPPTLRDAFLRVTKSGALPDYQIILAEAAKPLTVEAGYHDLFLFESDIAQVVGLILLFAESPGSLAELGAFAALETVAPSLMAVIEDYYYEKSSFIKNGPIKYLEGTYGDERVLVLDREELKISNDDDKRFSEFDLTAFAHNIIDPLHNRINAQPKTKKFNKENDGHRILLITGLCQEYGALKLNEIKKYLEHFGVSHDRLENLLYCSTLLGWITKTKKGNNTFYVGARGDNALDYSFLQGAKNKDKIRWRLDIRQHWKENDKPRARAIHIEEGEE